MVTLLDPTDERVPVTRQISPREGTLKGTVALLDISKPRGDVMLDELARLLAQRAPEIEVRRYKKTTFAKPCPDTLRAQIADECDYMIEALAD